MAVEKTLAFSRSMKFGRYVLDEKIGEGGMAEVYRARLTGNDGFEKTVCVKRILPHLAQAPDFASMFRDEAAIAARLQHQNIVQIFDFGTEGGALYIAMEFVDGVSLARILQTYSARGERLPLASVLKIAVEMCRGLHHAHTATANGKPLGLVHRDVTPHNILVSKAGEVKVADFGVARAEGRRTHTQSGVVKGKLHYMAPEQALGLPFDHRLDQFATGIVLWESLTGRRLFKGKSDFLILESVTRVEIPSAADMRNDVPPRLNAIVRRALEKDPEKRFPDMAALGSALDEVLFATAKSPAALDLKPIVARTLDRGAQTGSGARPPPTVSVRAPELAKSDDEPFDEPTAAAMKADGASAASSSGVWAADGDDARNRVDDPTDNVEDMRTTSDARGRIGARNLPLPSDAHGEPRTGASSHRPSPRGTITAPTLVADARARSVDTRVVAGGALAAVVLVALVAFIATRGSDKATTGAGTAVPTVVVGAGGIGSSCGPHDDLAIAPSSALPWVGVARPGANAPGDVRVVVRRSEPVGLVLAAESTVRWHIETAPGARVDRVILVSKWPQTIESAHSVTVDDMSGASAAGIDIDWSRAEASIARALSTRTGALAATVVCPSLREVALVDAAGAGAGAGAGAPAPSATSDARATPASAPSPLVPELRVADTSALSATCEGESDGTSARLLRYVAPQSKGTEVHVVGAGDANAVRVTSSRTRPHAIVLASGSAKTWKIERASGSGLTTVIVTGARGQRVSGADGVQLVDLSRGETSGWRWPESDAASTMPVTFAYGEREGDGRIASYIGCEAMTSAAIDDGALVPSGAAVASARDLSAVRERLALVTSPPERCRRGCPDPLRLAGFRVFSDEELDPETPPEPGDVRRRLQAAVVTVDDARALLSATERCKVCADESP